MRAPSALALLTILVSAAGCMGTYTRPVDRALMRTLPTIPAPPARDRRFDAAGGITLGSIASAGSSRGPAEGSDRELARSVYLPDVQLDLALTLRLSRFVALRLTGDLAPPVGANELGDDGAPPPGRWVGRGAVGVIVGYASEDEPFSMHLEVDGGVTLDALRGSDVAVRSTCEMGDCALRDTGAVSQWERSIASPLVRATVTAAYWVAAGVRPYVSAGVQTRGGLDGTMFSPVVGVMGAGVELRVADLSLLLTVSWPFGEPDVVFGPLLSIGVRGAGGDGVGTPQAWARVEERRAEAAAAREAQRLQRVSNAPAEETSP